MYDAGPKFVLLTLPKAKAQNIRVGNEERFIDGEGTNQEYGRLNGTSIHLKKVQSSDFFYIKGRGNGRNKKQLTSTDIWATAGVQGGLC